MAWDIEGCNGFQCQIAIIDITSGEILLSVVIDHSRTCEQLPKSPVVTAWTGTRRRVAENLSAKYYAANQDPMIGALPRVTLTELADEMDTIGVRERLVLKWFWSFFDTNTVTSALNSIGRLKSAPIKRIVARPIEADDLIDVGSSA